MDLAVRAVLDRATRSHGGAATPAQVYEVWLDHKSPGSPWFGTARAIVSPSWMASSTTPWIMPAGPGVTLRHTNVPDDEMGRMHAGGWGYVLGAIAERLGKR